MIRRQVVMPVTPERLWAALTDPDEMAGWFGARVEWELEPGSPARFRGDDGRDRSGRVVVVRPGRHLRFRWWPTDRRPESPEAQELAPETDDVSEVSYVLEPVPGGTRLTIQEQPVDRSTAGRAQARTGWTAWDGRLALAWGRLDAPACQGARA
jgi:uncharacterized protein YndB with AHSA1/START domain